MRIASSRSSPPSATSAACSAAGEPSCSRCRAATPSIRSRAMRVTSAVSDGVCGGGSTAAPRARLAGRGPRTAPRPARRRRTRRRRAHPTGRLSTRTRTCARASPFVAELDGLGRRTRSARARDTAPRPRPLRPSPRTSPRPSAPGARPSRWRPRRCRSSPGRGSARFSIAIEPSAGRGGGGGGRRRPALRRQAGVASATGERRREQQPGPARGAHHSTLANTSRSSPSR